MARSYCAEHRGEVDEVPSSLQSARSRKRWAVDGTERRCRFLHGGGRVPPPCERRALRSHETPGQQWRADEAGGRCTSVRRGADLRQSVGCSKDHSKEENEESHHEFVRRGLIRGWRHVPESPQELARRWYRERQAKKRGIDQPKTAQQVKKICAPGKEEVEVQWTSRSRNSRCTVTSGHSEGRSTPRPDGLAACPGAGEEEAGPGSSRSRPVKQLGGKQQFFRQLEPSCEQLERASEGSGCIPKSGPPHVRTASATCAPLRKGDGEGTRSRRSAMEGGRLQQEDILEESKGASEVSLPRRSHPRVSSSPRARESSTPDGAHFAVDSSSQPGQWGLADCLDADPCGRPLPTPFLRRRCGSPSTCHLLSSLDERARQDDGQPKEKRCRQRRGRRSRGEKGGQRQKEGRKGQRQQGGQGERQRQLSDTTSGCPKAGLLKCFQISSYQQATSGCPKAGELTTIWQTTSGCPKAGEPATAAAAADETAKAGFSQFSVIRSFEDSWGSFGRFLKLVKSSGYHGRRLGPESPPKPEKGAQLFPSLLVLPSSMGKSKGARRRARRRGRSESWDYAEILWAYFTFLDGGSPYRASQQQRLLDRAVSNPWTSMHSAYAGYLHSEIHRYVRLQSDEPLSRGILKLSELVKVVQNSDYTSNLHVDRLTRVAKNVKPDRMSLPEKAGIVEPQAFLKGKHLETFRNMSQTVPHGVEPDHPTVGCYRVEPEDVGEVNRKLLDSGVATLIPEELAMRDSRGNIISGGLFAVDHKLHSDRIILDRRPFNELERRLVWARLPHGSLLTQLIVPKGFSIRGSGDDLSNYFYLLKHHEDWLPRNTVGKIFDGAGYEKYGGVPGRNYLLSFRVIAMGDLNAVDLAQQVHLEILQDSGCMNPGECMEFKHPLPASHTMEGLYTDDHIITQILPDKHHRNKGEKNWDEVLIERSRNQYANQGIPTSQSKKFDKADKFVAWGTELDNKTGRAGAPLIKLKQLSELLVRVTRLGAVSKKMLQGVTGLLVHPFMHRRSMMCLLQETFLWIEKLGDSESRPLPIAVREELCSCALVLPLCHSNIRWPVSCRLGASDASLTHGGRAAALVPPAVAQTLYRFAEHRGEAVRLDWVHGALEPPSTMQQAPEELQELVANIPWNQTESCSFARKHHINVLETRMIFRELKDIVHKSSQTCFAG